MNIQIFTGKGIFFKKYMQKTDYSVMFIANILKKRNAT